MKVNHFTTNLSRISWNLWESLNFSGEIRNQICARDSNVRMSPAICDGAPLDPRTYFPEQICVFLEFYLGVGLGESRTVRASEGRAFAARGTERGRAERSKRNRRALNKQKPRRNNEQRQSVTDEKFEHKQT